MEKENYIKKAFETIRANNLSEPFQLAPGSTVTDLEKYLESFKAVYLSAKDPRLENLFFQKIEQLKQIKSTTDSE
jgi:pentose-5-phosphate-3-epimerase